MRQVFKMSEGWRFSTQMQRTDFADAYHLTKTGAARGIAAISYDDNAWERILLPHDAAIKGELDLSLNNFGGFLPRPNTCYRRYFRLDESLRDSRIQLLFDGITGKSDVYINGVLAARSESGYNGIRVDMTDIARFGSALNVIAVLSDNSLPEGWWYEGAGMFREVWLIQSGRVAIEDDTIFVRSTCKENNQWLLEVDVQVCNAQGGKTPGIMKVELLDQGTVITQKQAAFMLAEREKVNLHFTMTVDNPRLWDIGKGQLYTVRLSTVAGEKDMDSVEVQHGFRTIRFDKDLGFLINGRREKLKGLCYHEDEGNLGIAIGRETLRRRVENLLGMGGNAYRCAHGTPHPELLRICDEMGVVVMDETRMFASTTIALKELEMMVRRDRNHPCIILWSMGNEEPWQGDERGERMTRTMRALVHRLDSTRPVTMAMNSGHLNSHSAAAGCDVIGLNYNIEDYDAFRAMYPDKPMVATEVFCLADENEENGVYGADEAVKTLRYAAQRPYLAGTFGWAGQDYRGEHRYLSFFTDACPVTSNGERKDGFYRYLAVWNTKPVVHICGHWNHTEGTSVPVVVFGNTEKIALYLNGQKIGCKSPGDSYKVSFEVPYTPGKLVALGFSEEQEMARDVMQSVDRPSKIRLRAQAVQAGERAVIEAEAVDAQGRRYPMASHLISFEADGGQIICADNADPYFHRGEGDADTMFYHGRARAVVQLPRAGGKVIIRAQSHTLEGTELTLETDPDITPIVPEQDNPYVNDWFVSRVWNQKPDIRTYTPDNQYIRGQKYFEPWQQGENEKPFYFRSGYVVLCTEPNLPDVAPGCMPAIVFEHIAAGAEVLISIRDYDNVVLKQFYHKVEDGGALRMLLDGAQSGDRLIIKTLFDSSVSSQTLSMPIRFEVS